MSELISNNGGHAKRQVRAAVERLRAHAELKAFFQKDCDALGVVTDDQLRDSDEMKGLIEAVVSKVPY